MASPVMEQYARVKRDHPGEILLFRMGDFYEMFYEDAKTASEVLGIVLTSRQKGEGRIPMCGVPFHSADSYVHRLLKAGHRVAVCEQLEDAAQAKGIVDRGVVRVITPGTLVEEEGLLEETRHNFLAAVVRGKKRAGMAWVDLSTGLFLADETGPEEVADELGRLFPSETLVPSSMVEGEEDVGADLEAVAGILTPRPDWAFDPETGKRDLCEHFETKNLNGFGCEDLTVALGAAGALLEYLKETQRGVPKQITRIARHHRDGRVHLDRQTQASLELTGSLRDGGREGSLLGVLDRTRTPMGARLMRDWLTAPLREAEEIRERVNAVEELQSGAEDLRERLRGIGDLERVLSRIGSGRAGPRDLSALRDSLGRLPALRKGRHRAPLLKKTKKGIGDHSELQEELERAVVERPPALLTEGGILREGYDEELDRLRATAGGGKEWLAEFERREVERSGIPSLKVGFNRVFGYYIEITHAHRAKVPTEYVRKQTLKNAERYITPALKEHETTVLQAEEQAKRRETELVTALRERAASEIGPLQSTAASVAQLDVLASFAETSKEFGYVRPEVDDSEQLEIEAGRHPVVERLLEGRFVPNDTKVGGKNRIQLLTGPNMAGKSTYIRQVALLTLMAQAGSFVPAKRMRVGAVDRIFTRVGASDDLTRGASTFMVEMNETANILHHATSRSLVILDEVGRGTSTFDGLSIAWAVTEYLHDKLGARTLFATHYHELTELADQLSGVKNLHIAVREWGESIIFLHQIVEGATDRSYGIQVARLAGIPREVVERAKMILNGLEQSSIESGERSGRVRKPKPGEMKQLSLFDPPEPATPDPLREALKEADPEQMTPLQALQKLTAWKKEFDEFHK